MNSAEPNVLMKPEEELEEGELSSDSEDEKQLLLGSSDTGGPSSSNLNQDESVKLHHFRYSLLIIFYVGCPIESFSNQMKFTLRNLSLSSSLMITY